MTVEERLIEGLLVEYDVQATGRARHPLLFVHGAWSGSWIFAHYLDYLAAGGWNCYAMNLRGHYRSTPLDLTGVKLGDYANDIIRIAHQMPAAPILIGFGTGAHLVQLALSKNPPAVGAIFISAKFTRPAGTIPHRMPVLIPAEPIAPAPDLDAETLAWLNTLRADSFEPRSVLGSLLSGRLRVQPESVSVPYLVLNGALDDDISAAEGQELASYFVGGGTLDLLPETSHTGILVGTKWDRGANAINYWLGTNGFAAGG